MRLTKTGLILLLAVLLALIAILFFAMTQPAKAQEVVVLPAPPSITLPERAAGIVGACTAGTAAAGALAGLALTPLTAPVAIVTILICAIVADTELPE